MTVGRQDSRDGSDRQRVDQWLWFARIAKTRTLAQALVERGKVRVNRSRIEKASHAVKVTDVITISLGPRVRVLQVQRFGARRGPSTEAAALYVELTPERETSKSETAGMRVESAALGTAVRERGSGRPTKRERRATDRLKGR